MGLCRVDITLDQVAAFWRGRAMNGDVVAFSVQGDGYVRVEWRDESERGSYYFRAADIIEHRAKAAEGARRKDASDG